MKKYILTGTLMMAVFVSFLGCDDRKTEFLDEYSTILYFPKNGETPVTLYKTGFDSKYAVGVYKAGSDNKAQTAVSAEVLSDANLAIYNNLNNTNYVSLPASCYTIDSDLNIVFGSSDQIKKINVTFKTDEIYKLINTNLVKAIITNYVLPIQLVSSKDSINTAKKYAFVKPSVLIPSVYFSKVGYTRTVIDANSPESIPLTLAIQMPIKNQWDFECQVQVNQTLLNDYNTLNNKSVQLLPASSYTFDSKAVFTSKDAEKSLNIKVDKTKLQYGEYILPLELTTCSMSTFVIDQNKKSALLGVSYSPPLIPLTADMLSTNAQEPSEGPITDLIDGDIETYFHSVWSEDAASLPHNIQIKLNTAITAFKFQYYTRSSNEDTAPVIIDLMISNDGVNFEKLATIDKGLPDTGKTAYNSEIFISDKAFKYLRLDIPKSNAGIDTYFSMAEFKLWAK